MTQPTSARETSVSVPWIVCHTNKLSAAPRVSSPAPISTRGTALRARPERMITISTDEPTTSAPSG